MVYPEVLQTVLWSVKGYEYDKIGPSSSLYMFKYGFVLVVEDLKLYQIFTVTEVLMSVGCYWFCVFVRLLLTLLVLIF